jgi:hypothetical protein
VSVLTDERTMRTVRLFDMDVVDDEGVTHRYLLKARSLRDAKRQAREWMTHVEWSATLVEVRPMVDQRSETRVRRLLVVAGITFAVSGIALTTMMVIGLSLQGAI